MIVRTWMKLTVAGVLLVGGAALAGCTSPASTSSATPSASAAASGATTPSPTPTVAPTDAAAAAQLQKELDEVGPAAFTAPDYKPGKVEHVVLFSYKPGTSQETIDQIANRFRALSTEAVRDGKPYIVSLVSGPQISGEKAGKNMEAGFIVEFKSEGDRNYYVGTPVVTDPKYFEPAHAEFKDFVGPYLADVVVYDFVAK
ncbi:MULTISPECIES: Dabb family protein [Bacteria]|uniref:Dabb family protein n=1 Tax=Bacteria TaxID=2 RepID=UPI003C7E2DBF